MHIVLFTYTAYLFVVISQDNIKTKTIVYWIEIGVKMPCNTNVINWFFSVWWTPASSSLSLCVSCIYSSWIPFHFDFCLFTPKWTLHQLYFFLQIEKKLSIILHTLLEKKMQKEKITYLPYFPWAGEREHTIYFYLHKKFLKSLSPTVQK